MGWDLVTTIRSAGRLALKLFMPQIFFSLHDVQLDTCRCFPDDACWPSSQEWAAFNQTVNGHLVATIPLGVPCHDSAFGSYNATECAILRERWTLPELQYFIPLF